MKLKKLCCLAGIGSALMIGTIVKSYSQSPGMGSANGIPGVGHVYNLGSLNLWANLDGSSHINEYLYFNVVAANSGNKSGTDTWYSNPTAWLTSNEFHLNNAALRMHDNPIIFNNGVQNRKIALFRSAENNHQFYGFGVNDNILRYQIDVPTSSHVFYCGVNATSSKELLRIQGNGIVKIPQAGLLEFGADVIGKEANAGKIGYALFSTGQDPVPHGLDIVGAGTDVTNRRIDIWAEGGTNLSGALYINSPTHPTTLPGGISLSSYKLFVDGGILAKEIRVKAAWADYVFNKDYQLSDLKNVDIYIKNNGHLPGIPSAAEVEKNGINLGEMVKMQQEKIEESMLYIIQLKKEITQLRKEMDALAAKDAKEGPVAR